MTAASGQYETTLMSEMAKSDAPTLFQVNGPVGLANWKDYCYDLTGTKILGDLTSDSYALKDGDATLGVGYVIESYGLITNKTLLEKAGYTVDDIKSFDDLKKVAEDITARKDELGFSAFTSAGMDGSSDWRYKTHLANLPIYFEYQEDGIDNTDAIKGTYLDNYKNIFDLYINNSTCDPAELAGKTGDDSRNEFLNEEAVFFQNGSWEYTNLVGDGKPFTDDDLTCCPSTLASAMKPTRACAPALRTTGASTRKPARTTSTQRSTSSTGVFPLTRAPRPWLTTWASLSPSRMLLSPPTSSSRPIRK